MRKNIIILLLSVVGLLPVAAQKGLAIADLFDGHFKKQDETTEVLLSGKRISRYKLTLFRSLSLPGNGDNGRLIEQKVRTDAAQAVERETGYKGKRLYYGFFRLPPIGKSALNRFIFFRNDGLLKEGKPTLTLIYMEGTASIEELRRNFAK